MQPYNVKIVLFPDLTKQVRIYNNLIEHVPGKRDRKNNPFNDEWVTEVNNLEDHFENVHVASMRRTKRKVYDYAKCNEWDYFVTFTFNKHCVDRYDYDECVNKLSKWLNNLRRSSPGLSYLVVPEQHKDGAWHFHGLFAGLCESELVWSGKYVIKKIRRQGCRTRFVKTDRKIYQFGKYRLGWMTATEVQDKQKVVTYITKYVTKDMQRNMFGKKRYWVSRNLSLPTEETFLLDEVDRFILSNELLDECTYQTVSQSNTCTTQRVEIYEYE